MVWAPAELPVITSNNVARLEGDHLLAWLSAQRQRLTEGQVRRVFRKTSA